MSEQGLSIEGSLSTALSDSLFKLLGIDSFIKEKSCSRSEPPYSINQLQENGWSSGLFLFSKVTVLLDLFYYLLWYSWNETIMVKSFYNYNDFHALCRVPNKAVIVQN